MLRANEFLNKVMGSIQDYCSESNVLLTGGLLREDADQGCNLTRFCALGMDNLLLQLFCVFLTEIHLLLRPPNTDSFAQPCLTGKVMLTTCISRNGLPPK
jgi:hypothetical protein